jgi:hypothetical protein
MDWCSQKQAYIAVINRILLKTPRTDCNKHLAQKKLANFAVTSEIIISAKSLKNSTLQGVSWQGSGH